jgi:hypothetical protein
MRYGSSRPVPNVAPWRQFWIVVMLFTNRLAAGSALSAAFMFAAITFTAAQGAAQSPQSAARGVKHVLYLSVKSDDPDMQNSSNAGALNDQASKDQASKDRASKETPATALRFIVRLSDHSQETSFFGDVPVSITNFDLAKGSPEKLIWQDERCHHVRGFPRMLLMAVDGVIAHGSDKQAVEARPRQIGLPIPWDEIMMASGLQFSTDDRGPFIETRTRTKESRLGVDLKMYMLPCEVQ